MAKTVQKSSGARGAIVGRCKCRNEYQDQQYGTGMRVLNLKANSGTRCSVCLAEQNPVKSESK